MRALLHRISGSDALGAALLAAGATGMLAGAVARSPWLLALALAAFLVGDPLLYRGVEQLAASWFSQRHFAAAQRSILRETVVITGWAHIANPSGLPIVLAITAMVAVHAAHVVFRVISQRTMRLRKRRIIWQNLDVDGETQGPRPLRSAVPALGSLSGPRMVLAADIPLLVGLVVTAFTRGWTIAVVASLVTLGLALLAIARAARQFVLERRLPSPVRQNKRLRRALKAYAPEVVVYFSGPLTTTYQLNVWLETIDRISRRTLIIVREKHHLEDLLPTTTPIVVLPRAQDVDDFQLPSMKVALYPTTVARNNHMIRLQGIRHVFINHGDGDKSVTYSPLHRVFDEIWVAGQAAVDRYLQRGEGVRPDQLVTVGRPQLAHIARASERLHGGPVTVLYAPTWEGNFDGVDYSSVAPMGVQIVRTLLSSDRPVRVLFKAHPATGSRLASARAARQEVERMVAQAGSPHAVVAAGPLSLYDAFNEADVLISDVSSVVADFLASRKPYLVTNPKNRPTDELTRDLPSTRAGGIVAPGATNLLALLEDACGADALRERRHSLATYFLGEPLADPIQHFVDEVDLVAAGRPQVITEARS